MKPKLIVIFLLIVLLPLGLLVWLGVRVARNEREMVRQRFREVLTGRLNDTRATVAGLIEERERELQRITELPSLDAASIRALVRKTPTILQIFVLDAKGERIHPPPDGPISSSEREFLERAGQIWKDKEVFYRLPEQGAALLSPQANAPAQQQKYAKTKPFAKDKLPQAQTASAPPAPSHGWYAWYWGSGLNLAFWRRDDAGRVIGVEVNRVRMLADIIGKLPDTDPIQPGLSQWLLPSGRIRLIDSKGDAAYQWGAYDPATEERPAAETPLEHPLNSWKLEYFASGGEFDRAFGGGILFNLISGFAVIAIALVGLAVYFYRESSREMREAAQRVSFVNQVSHELKTPLTNIRMYAELLEDDLPEEHAKARERLGIVVSESQRLSRLINNVLTFARKQRDKLTLRMSTGNVDDLIASVIESFRPSLESKGVKITFSGGAGAAVRFDSDALEQILGNLFSNVEKYAASGGAMEVRSRQEEDRTAITVADKGPGIPEGHREKVFEPFHRLSDKLTDGAAGTGIGLTLSRDLARLHGGDLRLAPSEEGACFEVTLHTPLAADGGEHHESSCG